MSKRGHHQHLSNREKAALHEEIRAGETNRKRLAEKYNLSERNIGIHFERVLGKPQREKRDRATHSPKKAICRFSDCRKVGTGRPPYCKSHQPSKKQGLTLPWTIPMKRLMAGRA
jgi:hypothetical protein